MVPDPVERAAFFVRIRKGIEARARDAQMESPENSEASENSNSTAENSDTPINHVEMDENGFLTSFLYWSFDE